MALTDAYLAQVKNIHQILEALRQAKPPDRFTHKFLESLDFKSTNDRPIVGVLKALGFLDESGTPKQPYFDYLDDEKHKVVLAEGIRRAYDDLFKLNTEADKKDAAWVKNKLKSLTQGAKSNAILYRMAATFVALCKEADFSATPLAAREAPPVKVNESSLTPSIPNTEQTPKDLKHHRFALAYNIHIELPAVRDQEVYDAIFKSLRENLL